MGSKKNPVNWFEIPVSNLGRARTFYEMVLRCEMTLQEMGPLKMACFPIKHGAGYCPGTLVQHESYTPSHQGTTVYFHVENLEETLQRAATAGGKILSGKESIGEFGFTAFIEDSEGNRVGLHSDKQEAIS